MEKPGNSICVIFGGTGDLTRRKLMPALFRVLKQDMLSPDFALVGISLEDYTQSSYKELIKNSIIKYSNSEAIDKNLLKKFIDKIYYFKLNAKNSEAYLDMKQFLGKIDKNIQGHKNYLYYLAVKPDLHAPIITNLGRRGLSKEKNNEGWKRIIIEKPFGSDLSSARSLNQLLQKHFNENQIYRIDHYLGKETVQNILAFRFANGIFEPLWNRNYIDHVEITGSEKNGVGIRGEYYDQAGALRDMVQNHLLQILATIAMEPPNSFEARQVRNEKVKIFQALCPIDVDNIEKSVIRGQYIASQINGKKVLSYRNEDKVNPQSRTETYVALKAFVDNWRWSGVPFYIRTGKRLPARVNEVVINFKKTPHYLFKRIHPKDVGANKLILRIQPDEGIVIKFGM
ncbi:MAG: glucose-6-phosphate dehydrogenase, partial [Candidatus Marinimicrobia bacterium]|nr:glucose-6-phosphate dehydrogenase [Candidatus Neomarinimicrobiota bacterium]